MTFKNTLKHLALAFACMLGIGLSAAQAQTAAIYGSLGNFDVINHTGHDAHGFEIQFEGLHEADIYYTFSYQRYGSPVIVPYANGVYVRWSSAYNSTSQSFLQTTVPHATSSSFGGTCYMGQPNYDASGCEHFGVSLRNATTLIKTTYRWLIADPAAPSNLVTADPPAAIPGTPVYAVIAPARAGEAAALEAEIEAPEPPEAPELYGDAQWVKIFKTQLNREVTLDELITTNPVVPQTAAQVEVEWDILQAEPASNGNRRRHRNQGTLDPTTRAVVRRYETYQFTGAYDPVTHQAVCADLTCTAPAANEVGEFLGAQMAAANVEVNAVIVAKTGNGSVASADKLISCGNKCAATYNAGSIVTLTANPGNLAFTGWTGACTGNQLTCAVTVNGQTNVGATFVAVYNLSVSRNGKGSILSTPQGINCGGGGGGCSAKFAQGTAVTLTATPDPGFRFSNWTGACTGNATTCNVTMTKDTSVQAIFVK